MADVYADCSGSEQTPAGGRKWRCEEETLLDRYQLLAVTKTVLLGPAEQSPKTYKGQFLYLMFQVMYAFSDKPKCINDDHLPPAGLG